MTWSADANKAAEQLEEERVAERESKEAGPSPEETGPRAIRREGLPRDVARAKVKRSATSLRKEPARTEQHVFTGMTKAVGIRLGAVPTGQVPVQSPARHENR